MASFNWEYLVQDQNAVFLVQLSFTELVQKLGKSVVQLLK